jgi:hypothetical protein
LSATTGPATHRNWSDGSGHGVAPADGPAADGGVLTTANVAALQVELAMKPPFGAPVVLRNAASVGVARLIRLIVDVDAVDGLVRLDPLAVVEQVEAASEIIGPPRLILIRPWLSHRLPLSRSDRYAGLRDGRRR